MGTSAVYAHIAAVAILTAACTPQPIAKPAPTYVEFTPEDLSALCAGGDGNSCYTVEREYLRGVNLVGNSEAGLRYLTRACSLKILEACMELGDHYESAGTSFDLTTAAHFFRKGCKQGSTRGCRRAKELTVRVADAETDSEVTGRAVDVAESKNPTSDDADRPSAPPKSEKGKVDVDASHAPAATTAAIVEVAATAAENVVLDEAATRRLIDEQLRIAGWEVDSVELTYAAGARRRSNRGDRFASHEQLA